MNKDWKDFEDDQLQQLIDSYEQDAFIVVVLFIAFILAAIIYLVLTS